MMDDVRWTEEQAKALSDLSRSAIDAHWLASPELRDRLRSLRQHLDEHFVWHAAGLGDGVAHAIKAAMADETVRTQCQIVGHDWYDFTTLGDRERNYRCLRCRAERTDPR